MYPKINPARLAGVFVLGDAWIFFQNLLFARSTDRALLHASDRDQLKLQTAFFFDISKKSLLLALLLTLSQKILSFRTKSRPQPQKHKNRYNFFSFSYCGKVV